MMICMTLTCAFNPNVRQLKSLPNYYNISIFISSALLFKHKTKTTKTCFTDVTCDSKYDTSFYQHPLQD